MKTEVEQVEDVAVEPVTVEELAVFLVAKNGDYKVHPDAVRAVAATFELVVADLPDGKIDVRVRRRP